MEASAEILEYNNLSCFCIKQPEKSFLGKEIVEKGLTLIHTLGFDNFTIKKLSLALGTSETSIYRYFESKYKLLHYLISLYWVKKRNSIEAEIRKVVKPKEKLRIILTELCNNKSCASKYFSFSGEALKEIVINHFAQAHFTKETDYRNFYELENICNLVDSVIKEINPLIKFSKTIAFTAVNTIYSQLFLAQNLPHLFEFNKRSENEDSLVHFLENTIYSMIRVNQDTTR